MNGLEPFSQVLRSLGRSFDRSRPPIASASRFDRLPARFIDAPVRPSRRSITLTITR